MVLPKCHKHFRTKPNFIVSKKLENLDKSISLVRKMQPTLFMNSCT